jgi:hypothetical protein
MLKLLHCLLISGLCIFLPAQEKSPGEWISLFDGKTTSGWHTFGKKTAGFAWKAENGTLHLDASEKINGSIVGGGDIVTG